MEKEDAETTQTTGTKTVPATIFKWVLFLVYFGTPEY